jgi:predicted nucleic acid-binding protein
MMMSNLQVAIDSSVLVGLINPDDLWRDQAVNLKSTLLDRGAELLYFDCVVVEAVSTATRRLHERKRQEDVAALLERLAKQVPSDTITWILPDVQRLYLTALDLMRISQGALNFNDALIALACRERGIPAIASFDVDFDSIAWLRRLSQPHDVT